MAALPLTQTIDAASAKGSWRSSVLSLLTSTLIQCLVVVVLAVTPLVAIQSLPEPESRWAIGAFVPVVPTAPAAPSASVQSVQQSRTVRPPSAAAVLDRFVAPAVIPTGVLDEPFFERGVAGGIPAGVVGSLGAPSVELPVVAPPPERPSGPVRPGGDIRYPRKIRHVSPVYPRIAREARVEGVVKLETTIDAAGNVVNLRVIDSVALLDAAAIDAVRQWRYEPTYLNGTPVPVLLTVEVVFQLAR